MLYYYFCGLCQKFCWFISLLPLSQFIGNALSEAYCSLSEGIFGNHSWQQSKLKEPSKGFWENFLRVSRQIGKVLCAFRSFCNNFYEKLVLSKRAKEKNWSRVQRMNNFGNAVKILLSKRLLFSLVSPQFRKKDWERVFGQWSCIWVFWAIFFKMSSNSRAQTMVVFSRFLVA